jgi:hypothetical protein
MSWVEWKGMLGLGPFCHRHCGHTDGKWFVCCNCGHRVPVIRGDGHGPYKPRARGGYQPTWGPVNPKPPQGGSGVR